MKSQIQAYYASCALIVLEFAYRKALCLSIMAENNERKSEQAHIPHAPTLLENAVYNEWQFQALGTGNRTKKGI